MSQSQPRLIVTMMMTYPNRGDRLTNSIPNAATCTGGTISDDRVKGKREKQRQTEPPPLPNRTSVQARPTEGKQNEVGKGETMGKAEAEKASPRMVSGVTR